MIQIVSETRPVQLLFERWLGKSLSELVICLSLVTLPLACGAEDATSGGLSDVSDSPAAQTAEVPSATGEDQGTPASSGQGEKYYTVDCEQADENGNEVCLTDKATYVGWRTFHATCHVCHGPNAVGSSFAPSLLKHIDKAKFVDVVKNGRSGQIGVMPPWGENPNVKDFIDELYAYQQARADGALKPGRPKKMD